MRKFIPPLSENNGTSDYAVANENGHIVCKTNSYAVACQALADDVFQYNMDVLGRKMNEPGAIHE